MTGAGGTHHAVAEPKTQRYRINVAPCLHQPPGHANVRWPGSVPEGDHRIRGDGRHDRVADPAQSVTVRQRDGGRQADGEAVQATPFVCGYYVVDCASKERAIKLAARIPTPGTPRSRSGR